MRSCAWARRASLIGGLVLAVAGVLAMASPAGASGPIGIRATWNYPGDYHVKFSFIRSYCTRDEKSPDATIDELRRQEENGVLHLFDDKTDGGCHYANFQNVEYKVTVTSPSGESAWRDIDIKSGGSGGLELQRYHVICNGDQATVPCAGEGLQATNSPKVRFGPAAPAGGFTFCSLERTSCTVSNRSPKTVAYGADGHFLYWNMDADETSISCNNATWGDLAKGIGKSCWVRYR